MYLGACHTSMVHLFIETIYDYLLTIFAKKHSPTDVLHDHKYSSGQGTSLIILNIFDSSYVLYINSLEQFSGFRKRLEALTHAPISIQIFRYLLQFYYSCSLGFLFIIIITFLNLRPFKAGKAQSASQN